MLFVALKIVTYVRKERINHYYYYYFTEKSNNKYNSINTIFMLNEAVLTYSYRSPPL